MSYPAYVLRRLFGGLVTIWAVVTVCFVILNALPGDPAEIALGETATLEDRARFRATYHLDQPLPVRYREFLSNMVVPSRQMGRSFRQPQTVSSLIAQAWPSTFALALSASFVGWLIAIPLALQAAYKPKSKRNTVIGVVSLLGLAIPSLWIGPMLILLFCVTVPLLPFPGPDARGIASLILPAFTLGFGLSGALTRMTTAALKETLREQYVMAARARGLPEIWVLLRHGLRPALVPVLTTAGAQLTGLLGGAIVTEKIFARSGLGTLLFESVATRDMPVVLGCVIVISATAVFIQFLVDIAYVLVDPRIRL